jgi:phosphoglycerol transferase MdoB-like AlkP superfamily enzyme
MKEVLSRSVLLASRLLVSFFVFSLCRLAYFLLNLSEFRGNSFLEVGQSFLWGIWFDVVPVFYYNLLFIVLHVLPHPWWYKRFFQKALFYLFLLVNTVACIQNLGDAAYYPYNKKRTGAEIFHIAKDWDTSQLYNYFTDFAHLFLICFLVLFIAIVVWRKIDRVLPVSAASSSSRSNWLLWAGHLVIWTILVILGLRGGWGLIPLRTFDAGRFVNTSLVPLTTNSPFQLICTVEAKEVPSPHFMTQEQADLILAPSSNDRKGAFRKKNVVIIIVESLGKEYVGFYNKGKGYTPFLDSLCRFSRTFEYGYANGTTSMDAPPAILSGIPQLIEESYIVSPFNTNTPESIGSILGRKGYNSSFYHGGKNGTMGFDNFVSLSGMGTYSGLDQYPDKNDFDGNWGIFDEPYLQFFAEELSQKPQPFVSAVFTLSSHHPYIVPKKYASLLPKGTMPIHKSIAYVDLALKKFFQKASTLPWYQNTLFVITADHTSDSDDPSYQTLLGRYSIPFILYCPSDTSLKGTSSRIMQQSLILPTLLDYLHYDLPFFHLGASAIDSNKNSFAVFYTGGHYYLVNTEYILSISPNGKSEMYEPHKDPYLHHPIENKKVQAQMEQTLKAYLQSGISHLKDNTFGYTQE